MARVINLVRRSEAEWVYEQEVNPGQWMTTAEVPVTPATPEKPVQQTGPQGPFPTLLDWARSFFRGEALRISPTQLRPPGVGPAGPLFEPSPPPVPPPVQGPLPFQPPLGVTPAQLVRLATEMKIRDQQIKNYLASPIGWVWQKSKELPGTLVQVPVKRPLPPPGEIEALFPLPTYPTPQQLAGFGPAPVRVYKGSITTPEGTVLNLWEDFSGNEVRGYREEAGQFGQVEQILEY